MRLRVDTPAVHFVAAGPAEPAVDFDTKTQKTDDSGQPIFPVHLFAVGAGGRDVITVKVAGEPKGMAEFTPVRVTELVATTWPWATGPACRSGPPRWRRPPPPARRRDPPPARRPGRRRGLLLPAGLDVGARRRRFAPDHIEAPQRRPPMPGGARRWRRVGPGTGRPHAAAAANAVEPRFAPPPLGVGHPRPVL